MNNENFLFLFQQCCEFMISFDFFQRRFRIVNNNLEGLFNYFD